MKLCSYEIDGKFSYGAIGPDSGIIDLASRIGARHPSLLALVKNNALDEARVAADKQRSDYEQEKVRLIPLFHEQVTIQCIGLNYAAHTAESGMKQPDFPRTFIKIHSALVGHNEKFEMPTLSHQFDWEGELAVVMGRTARNVRASDAAAYIAGYTCFMDGSVRDYQLQRTTDQGKNFFRSSSMGPWLVTPDEVGDLNQLSITTMVSGQRMQHSSFDKMLFPVPTLIEYVSAISELRAGDVIATGTPEGVGFKRTPPRFLQPGDSVEVIIDRVGTLRNVVA